MTGIEYLIYPKCSSLMSLFPFLLHWLICHFLDSHDPVHFLCVFQLCSSRICTAFVCCLCRCHISV